MGEGKSYIGERSQAGMGNYMHPDGPMAHPGERLETARQGQIQELRVPQALSRLDYVVSDALGCALKDHADRLGALTSRLRSVLGPEHPKPNNGAGAVPTPDVNRDMLAGRIDTVSNNVQQAANFLNHLTTEVEDLISRLEV